MKSAKLWAFLGPAIVVVLLTGFWVNSQLAAVRDTAQAVETTVEAVTEAALVVPEALEAVEGIEVDSLNINTDRINTQLTKLGAGIGNMVRTAVDSAGGR